MSLAFSSGREEAAEGFDVTQQRIDALEKRLAKFEQPVKPYEGPPGMTLEDILNIDPRDIK